MSDNDLPIDGTGNEAPASVREITPRELARIRPLPVIIDIREEAEFMRGPHRWSQANQSSYLGTKNTRDRAGSDHSDRCLLRGRQPRVFGR